MGPNKQQHNKTFYDIKQKEPVNKIIRTLRPGLFGDDPLARVRLYKRQNTYQ